jgi:hypothetical protein
MPREFYEISQSPDLKSVITELNNIFQDLSIRLNHMSNDGDDISLNNTKLTNVKTASDGLDAPNFDQIVEKGEADLVVNRIVQTDDDIKLASVLDLTNFITQTLNQVLVASISGGKVKLSLPQDIHTGASPIFANLFIPTSGKIIFRDADIFIQSKDDGYLDFDADIGIRLNQDTTITGDSTVSGVRNQKYYCEAYIDEERTITIITKDVWHPAFGLTEGECSDFIRDEGGIATIISIVQNGSDITIETDAPHGFDVGDPTSFVGGTGYDIQHMITAVADTTHFDVTAAFTGDGTGFAIVGDNLEVPVDGIYNFNGWFSGNGSVGSASFEFTAVIDDQLVNKGKPSRKFANTTDRGNMGGGFYLSLTAGQKLSFVAQNLSNTNNFTSAGTNIRINRI